MPVYINDNGTPVEVDPRYNDNGTPQECEVYINDGGTPVLVYSPSQTIDDYERNDLSPYAVPPSSGTSTTSSAAGLFGDYGLEQDNFTHIWSLPSYSPSLNYYPAPGDTWEFYIKFDQESEQYREYWHTFGPHGNASKDAGTTDDADNQYSVRLVLDRAFQLYIEENGTGDELARSDYYPEREKLYRVEVEWLADSYGNSDGFIGRLYDADGDSESHIATLSTGDSTFSELGIGHRSSLNGRVYVDNISRI